MKKIIFSLFTLISISSNAAEVCKLASYYGHDSTFDVCTTDVICTFPSINFTIVDSLMFNQSIRGCDFTEIKAIKKLIDKGYQLESDGKTLVKH